MTTIAPERPARRRVERRPPRQAGGRIHPWRRAAALAQAAVVLGLPFLSVKGGPALRFDPVRLELHLLGAVVWMDELFVVLAGTLAVTFAFLLVTVLFGRLWCGWGCPQTALVDLTGFLDAARRRGGWHLAAAHAAVALLSALVAANLTWYVVPPGEFLARLQSFKLGPALGGSWAVGTALVFADLALWRQGFCSGACPYAKLQGALLDRRSMAVAYDVRRDGECVDCGACVRVCPVRIDIRDGLQAACTTCAACIDACEPIMARLGRPGKLIGYFFGEPASPPPAPPLPAGDGGSTAPIPSLSLAPSSEPLFSFDPLPPEGGEGRVRGASPRAESGKARASGWSSRLLLRPAVLALTLLTGASLTLTVAVATGRAPLDLEVALASDFTPRQSASGEAHLVLDVALENRGRAPLSLALSLEAPETAARLRPDHLDLAAGQHRRVRLHATVWGLVPDRPVKARLAATSPAGPAAAQEVQLAVAGGAR